MAAAVIYGSLLGVVLGVVVAALHHRLRGRNEFERGAKVAASAFVALVLIPALKYPPNPPTVGDPDTIGQRSTQFLLLMVASVVVVAAGWYLWEQLTERGWSGAPRFLAGGGGFLAMVTVLMLVWPASPDAIAPPDNEASPALEVSAAAPPEVLAAMLDTARETGDGWLRDPAAPDQPLDLDTVRSPEDLVGTPAAVDTTRLVANRLHDGHLALPAAVPRRAGPHVGGDGRRLRPARRPRRRAPPPAGRSHGARRRRRSGPTRRRCAERQPTTTHS